MLLLLAAAISVSQPVLSDAYVIAAASGPYDKAAPAARHRRLGSHHGIDVIAEYPCSDLCPAYTTRIVHYGLSRGRRARPRAASNASPWCRTGSPPCQNDSACPPFSGQRGSTSAVNGSAASCPLVQLKLRADDLVDVADDN